MRCLSCNKILTDYEATRKGKHSGEYIELCSHCFSNSMLVDIQIIDKPELYEDVDILICGG